MNKYSTIISLLLIVAFANCVKRVSYSDIVVSLMEVNQNDLTNLNAINESFEDSKKKLTQFDANLSSRCGAIKERGETKVQNYKNEIDGTNLIVQKINERNSEIQRDIGTFQEVVSTNKAEIKKNKNDLKDARTKLTELEAKIVERSRVLRRLVNIVDDELTGTDRKAEVGNYNTDKTLSGYSFLEVKNQLKEISEKADPVTKSMVAALIMITQDKKAIFANQDVIGKIKGLIEQILSKDREFLAKEISNHDSTVAQIKSLISKLDEEKYKKQDDIKRLLAEIQGNSERVNFLNLDVSALNKNLVKANKRNSINNDLCSKQLELVRVHNRDLESFNEKFNELKSVLS